MISFKDVLQIFAKILSKVAFLFEISKTLIFQKAFQ